MYSAYELFILGQYAQQHTDEYETYQIPLLTTYRTEVSIRHRLGLSDMYSK
jgi:hypothetical protein